MRSLAAAAVLLLVARPAAGQVVSDAVERAAVTIYRDPSEVASEPYERRYRPRPVGLAFISETRIIDLPAGRSRIAFRGVADTMVPQTVAIEGLPGAVIERNEDHDLLSPGALLEASIGQSVRMVRTDRKSGLATVRPAVVRSGPNGAVLEVDGKVEALGCSGAPERIVFDRIPDGLSAKPTLSVLADGQKAGRYTIRLSYLATGFNWSADYVATVAPDGRTLDLGGWLTLANHTSASFAQAPTDVVAGEVARQDDTRPPEVRPSAIYPTCWPLARRYKGPIPPPPPLPVPPVERRISDIEELVVTGSRIESRLAKQSDLGDYKLYTLPEPTTVAAQQTKQVRFLEQRRVPFERIYAYRMNLDDYSADGPEPLAPAVLLRVRNEVAAGLGKPLPSGTISVMEPAGRGAVLAGQHEVKDTPVGLPLDIEIGQAMDVAVTVRVAEEKAVGREDRVGLEVSFVNDKPQPIVLEYRQARRGSDFRIVTASLPSETSRGEPMWTLRLKPGQRATLAYTIGYVD